jgi:hypothetical protein
VVPEWELDEFGPCVAEWLQTSPPIEWRKPLHRWIRSLRNNAVQNALREPAIDDEEWSGWYCEVPGAGSSQAVVVVFYGVHSVQRIVKCLQISTMPRYRE